MERNKAHACHDQEVRKGPWTMEEDLILINYITNHGQGVWNDLARAAGLKRTGKSCRLRWLNYLRPDVRRGNISPEEEMLIVELHSRWGNRWSKIAKQLPGRTDNEIKNFWRTRIQKKTKSDVDAEGCSDQAAVGNADLYGFPVGLQGHDQSFAGVGMGYDGTDLCSPDCDYSDLGALIADEGPSELIGDGFWAVDHDPWYSMQMFHN